MKNDEMQGNMEDVNEILKQFGEVKDKMQGIIKVIGVGGGGCNAVRNMFDEKISGVTLAVCNTDSKSLAPSPVPIKILLGEGLVLEETRKSDVLRPRRISRT